MLVRTQDLKQGEVTEDNLQIYNGLDCCITMEVFEELSTLSNAPPPVYAFSRALQAPILEMSLRGFRIDEYERQSSLASLREKRTKLNSALQLLAYAVWDKPLNPNVGAHKQQQEFFYRHMRVPEIWSSQKGERKLRMNRETLEKIEVYLYARPIVACILAIRDLNKSIEFFETELDSDGRFRTSYNIGGTESWRLSSSKSATGTGGNAQNLKRDDDIAKGELSVRKPFVADQGMKLCVLDLEQAESREVGLIFGTLFNDWRFLDACEQGDLHTTTARLIWPELVHDRKSAEAHFYRHFTYRDMSKRGGHLTSYMGTAWTAARSLKVPLKLMEIFQSAFATGPKAAFPSFPRWWRWVAQELQTKHQITNSFGVTRTFFGRPNDDTTLREAIAHSPQSSTAMRTNLALWRIWRYLPHVQLLAQTHDSVTFQFRDRDDNYTKEVLRDARALMSTPLHLPNGRIFDVPSDCKIGWNWGAYDAKYNPNGLRKWKGSDERKRLDGVDRIL
jgi:hypothetical protein